jgi:hypothetical protein
MYNEVYYILGREGKMGIRRYSSRGEGQIGLVLFIVFIAAVGYFGYKYFWPKNKPAQVTQPKALERDTGAPSGSLAGQQVQGAQAAGELLGSGR